MESRIAIIGIIVEDIDASSKVNDIVTLWGLKIVLGTICAFALKFNPVLVYLILSSDEFFKALVTIPRVWKGKWIHYTTV